MFVRGFELVHVMHGTVRELVSGEQLQTMVAEWMVQQVQ